MASKKVKDVAVKTGSYTDRDGKTKNRYENIGGMFKSDDGSFYLMIKRTFNPAGIDVDPGRDSIIVSLFDLKDDQAAPPARSGAGYQQSPSAPPARQQQQAAQDDDIPF